MAKAFPQRMTAEVEGEFVVFLIGMHVNKPWQVHRWLPVFLAMPRMLRELAADPAPSFLGYELSLTTIVQYWRSFEQLEAYARDKDRTHRPAWVDFNKRIGRSRGDVGIWHETYRIAPGQYEAIYSGMPARGLGKVGRLVPAAGRRESARGRIGIPQEAAGELAPAHDWPSRGARPQQPLAVGFARHALLL